MSLHCTLPCELRSGDFLEPGKPADLWECSLGFSEVFLVGKTTLLINSCQHYLLGLTTTLNLMQWGIQFIPSALPDILIWQCRGLAVHGLLTCILLHASVRKPWQLCCTDSGVHASCSHNVWQLFSSVPGGRLGGCTYTHETGRAYLVCNQVCCETST